MIEIEKITSPRWTPEETLKLIRNYKNLPNRELQKLFPNRTFNSITRKKRAMRLVTPQVKWTREHLELLAAGQNVPGHSLAACRRKIIRLKQEGGIEWLPLSLSNLK